MKKYLLFMLVMIPFFAQARFIEAEIPSEIASPYMDKLLSVFTNSYVSDESALDQIFEKDGIQYVIIHDIAKGYKAQQICARRLSDQATRCIIRDYMELDYGQLPSGELRAKIYFARILWKTMPGSPKYDWGDWRTYKNLRCPEPEMGPGFCEVTNAIVKE